MTPSDADRGGLALRYLALALLALVSVSYQARAVADVLQRLRGGDRLNALIYEASPANRYATSFYGQYDATARRLEYVNAGHNAPMVSRRGNGGLEVLRVDGGGPVIGLLPGAPYAQQSGDGPHFLCVE